jgi:membrane associated rhomboid family serine protease
VARRGGLQLPRFLTFGDRVPPSIGLILALMFAGSVWGWMDRTLAVNSALWPELVLGGQIWRLVTWPFVERDPLTLLFGGYMIYWLGQQLSFVWSEQRFLLRFFGYTVFATVGTTLLAAAWPPVRDVRHLGIWPVANALLVSWALLFPDRQLNFWGVLPLTGRMTAWLVLGGTFLWGISEGGIAGILGFTPHLFALAAAWVLSRGLGVGGVIRDARGWLAERDAKRRARHLKVVKRDGEKDRPRWLN